MSAWKCPQCGARVGKHGKGGARTCISGVEDGCDGLICECEAPGADLRNHGTCQENPCENAACYHCGWGGRVPSLGYDPKKLRGWAKTALAAGWKPPAGWVPTPELMMSKTKRKT